METVTRPMCLTEDDYAQRMPQIEKELSNIVHEGSINSFDGCKLVYEYYLTNKGGSSIIIIHGYTEFGKKYHEMAWYFIQNGYNVFIYDQRGHGHSDRTVENTELTHVESFDEYAEDLHQFIEQVVKPNSYGNPIMIYSHSMGGAITALYLAKYKDVVKKAVMSAPMIKPVAHDIPLFLIRLMAKHYAKQDGWNGKFRHTGSFDPNPNFKFSSELSELRFANHMKYRISDVFYRNSGGTNRWIYESVSVGRRLLKKDVAGNIEAEILIINASEDRVVKPRPQRQFAKMVKNSEYISVKGAKHSIYSSPPDMLNQYLNTVFDFFEK